MTIGGKAVMIGHPRGMSLSMRTTAERAITPDLDTEMIIGRGASRGLLTEWMDIGRIVMTLPLKGETSTVRLVLIGHLGTDRGVLIVHLTGLIQGMMIGEVGMSRHQVGQIMIRMIIGILTIAHLIGQIMTMTQEDIDDLLSLQILTIQDGPMIGRLHGVTNMSGTDGNTSVAHLTMNLTIICSPQLTVGSMTGMCIMLIGNVLETRGI